MTLLQPSIFNQTKTPILSEHKTCLLRIGVFVAKG